MLDTINTRRSVRSWDGRDVDKKDVTDILEAAMNAPSAGNEQAWQFVVLSGKTLADYLSINGNCPKGAPVGILVCGDKKAQKYEGFYLYDCCAAIQNILLAVHTKGLGAVWTAVFPGNDVKTKQLLGLPEHIVPVSFVPIGYPDGKQPPAESRYDTSKVHMNAW
jgi:nitroreductase